MIRNSTKKIIKPIIYRIDAKGKPMGRIASKIAMAVQGKLLPNYSPEKLANVLVVVQNHKNMIFTGKKLNDKKYYRYTGYPGGIKVKQMEEMYHRNPEKVLLIAVRNMLPKNKLRSKMLKRIRFKK